MFRNNSKMNLILRDGEIERRNMTNKVDKAWKKEVEQSILTHRASELPSLNINIKKWASPTPTPCSPGEGGAVDSAAQVAHPQVKERVCQLAEDVAVGQIDVVKIYIKLTKDIVPIWALHWCDA